MKNPVSNFFLGILYVYTHDQDQGFEISLLPMSLFRKLEVKDHLGKGKKTLLIFSYFFLQHVIYMYIIEKYLNNVSIYLCTLLTLPLMF